MARLYTTEEAYKKLGVSQATFWRWLEGAKEEGVGEKVESQPSVDGRERLYGLTQLRWLANRHNKDVLPDEEIFTQEPQLEVEALRHDADDVRRQLREREGEIRSLRGDVQRLEQVLQAMDAKVQEAYSFCVQQVSQVVADMERLRAEISGASTNAPSPSPPVVKTKEGGQPVVQMREGGQPVENKQVKPPKTEVTLGSPSSVKRFERPSNRAHLEPVSMEGQHTWSEAELFEENWIDEVWGRLVSRARMAKAHAIPDTNLRRDIESRQVLTMVDKRWLYKGSWKTGGFNAAQRRRVWEEYHHLSWFTPCEICLRNQHQEV